MEKAENTTQTQSSSLLGLSSADRPPWPPCNANAHYRDVRASLLPTVNTISRELMLYYTCPMCGLDLMYLDLL
jgi:hypothetical protein